MAELDKVYDILDAGSRHAVFLWIEQLNPKPGNFTLKYRQHSAFVSRLTAVKRVLISVAGYVGFISKIRFFISKLAF